MGGKESWCSGETELLAQYIAVRKNSLISGVISSTHVFKMHDLGKVMA